MKKITFFIAVILSLNAGIVVRKDDEKNNITAKNKRGSMLWLQHFVNQLKTGFYLIKAGGSFQKINIQFSNKNYCFKQCSQLTENVIKFDYTEITK